MAPLDRIARPTGWFQLEIYEHGRLIERMDEPNLIVDQYATINARMLGGLAGYNIGQVGYGQNGTVPAVTDASLAGPYIKAIDAVTYGGVGQTIITYSLGAGEANGLSIFEFGLLSVTGSLLYARKTRGSPLIKTAAISFSGTWTLQS